MANRKIEKPTLPPGGKEKKPKSAEDGRKNNGGAREGAGRSPFEPTETERKQVEALSGYGLPFEQIAVLIREGISLDTLRKHFSRELSIGKAKANAQACKSIFQKVISGDTGMMKYWGGTQLGWRETQHHELTGAGGGPIAMTNMDLKGLNDTELAQMQALLQKANNKDE
jgi:hypothetical protein